MFMKIRAKPVDTETVEIGRGVRQGYCMASILFNLYGKYLIEEALAKVGDFKIRGKIILKTRFADGTAIIAKTHVSYKT